MRCTVRPEATKSAHSSAMSSGGLNRTQRAPTVNCWRERCCTSTINQPPQPHSLNAHLSSRNDRPEQQRCSRLATMSSFRPHLRHRACCCSQNRNPKLVSCRHRSFRFLKRRKCHQHHRNFQCRTWTCHQIRSKATTAKVRRRQPGRRGNLRNSRTEHFGAHDCRVRFFDAQR